MSSQVNRIITVRPPTKVISVTTRVCLSLGANPLINKGSTDLAQSKMSVLLDREHCGMGPARCSCLRLQSKHTKQDPLDFLISCTNLDTVIHEFSKRVLSTLQ